MLQAGEYRPRPDRNARPAATMPIDRHHLAADRAHRARRRAVAGELARRPGRSRRHLRLRERETRGATRSCRRRRARATSCWRSSAPSRSTTASSKSWVGPTAVACCCRAGRCIWRPAHRTSSWLLPSFERMQHPPHASNEADLLSAARGLVAFLKTAGDVDPQTLTRVYFKSQRNVLPP